MPEWRALTQDGKLLRHVARLGDVNLDVFVGDRSDWYFWFQVNHYCSKDFDGTEEEAKAAALGFAEAQLEAMLAQVRAMKEGTDASTDA